MILLLFGVITISPIGKRKLPLQIDHHLFGLEVLLQLVRVVLAGVDVLTDFGDDVSDVRTHAGTHLVGHFLGLLKRAT